MIEQGESWRRIAARVEAMTRAAETFLLAQRVLSEDPYGIGLKVFGAQGKLLHKEINQFLDQYRGALPPAAEEALDHFFSSSGLAGLLTDGGISGLDSVKLVVPVLAGITSQVSYLLADREAIGSRLVDRAFGHLQRSIAAVPSEAAVWQQAFTKGEIECEKLGGLHLLRFGIFASKADSAGARTDLILGDPLLTTDPLLAASEALILTEWKKANDKGRSEGRTGDVSASCVLSRPSSGDRAA